MGDPHYSKRIDNRLFIVRCFVDGEWCEFVSRKSLIAAHELAVRFGGL